MMCSRGKKTTRPDVQAAVTLVGRRVGKRDIGIIDLHRADLTDATLTSVTLTGADLIGADLARATLRFATFTGAYLRQAARAPEAPGLLLIYSWVVTALTSV
jgi:hypothetical protein